MCNCYYRNILWKKNLRVHKRLHQNYYNLLTQERAGNQASVQIMVPGITSSPRCAYNVASNRSTKDVVKYVTLQDLLHARIISWLSTITCASGIRNSSILSSHLEWSIVVRPNSICVLRGRQHRQIASFSSRKSNNCSLLTRVFVKLHSIIMRAR